MTTIETITDTVPLGSSATLTLQSRDSSATDYYSADYIYTLTYTGPETGTMTPIFHSANGLYSASFLPTTVGTYTVTVTLSNSYTNANPSAPT